MPDKTTLAPAPAALGTPEGEEITLAPESAPKNGTWFLGTFTDGETRRTSWGINRHDEKCWCTPTWYYYERELKSWQPLTASQARTIAALRAALHQARSSLSAIGRHYPDCLLEPCTCGLQGTRDEIDRALKEHPNGL